VSIKKEIIEKKSPGKNNIPAGRQTPVLVAVLPDKNQIKNIFSQSP
jgi:hypothetical protein